MYVFDTGDPFHWLYLYLFLGFILSLLTAQFARSKGEFMTNGAFLAVFLLWGILFPIAVYKVCRGQTNGRR